MDPKPPATFDRLLEEEAFASPEEIDLDHGPLGASHSAALAGTGVGIEPRSSSAAFRGFQVDSPRAPKTPVVVPPGTHPFVARVLKQGGSPSDEQKAALGPFADEQGWTSLDAQIQEALAEVMRWMMTGNRMMATPPEILRKAAEDTSKEIQEFQALPKEQQKKNIKQLVTSLGKVAQKHRHEQKHHASNHRHRYESEGEDPYLQRD